MSSYQQALAAFLERENLTDTELAARIGSSQVVVWRYRNGQRFPAAANARLIDEATGGEVSFATWQAEFLERSGLTQDQAA